VLWHKASYTVVLHDIYIHQVPLQTLEARQG
jgi:hypothetical protein